MKNLQVTWTTPLRERGAALDSCYADRPKTTQNQVTNLQNSWTIPLRVRGSALGSFLDNSPKKTQNESNENLAKAR